MVAGSVSLQIMTAMENLDQALAFMDPQLDGRYVFASVDSITPGLEPFATIHETEGLTLIVRADQAAQYGLDVSQPFARITARAQISLYSVGVTSTIASTIASRGIPCNVVVGAHHGYFFVPVERGEEALALLNDLATQASGWLPEE